MARKKIKITKSVVKSLLGWISKGLSHGLRDNAGHVCVQNAVNRAYSDVSYDSDSPECVDPSLRAMGIQANDKFEWGDVKGRAEGLRRFAVAELGTGPGSGFDINEFNKKFAELHGTDFSKALRAAKDKGRQGLTDLMNSCADILVEMKTAGSEWMCMIDCKREEVKDNGSTE